MFQTLYHDLQACLWLCVSLQTSPLASSCFLHYALGLSDSFCCLKDPNPPGLYRTLGNFVVGIVRNSVFSASFIQHETLGEMSFTTSLRVISLASHFKKLLEDELFPGCALFICLVPFPLPNLKIPEIRNSSSLPSYCCVSSISSDTQQITNMLTLNALKEEMCLIQISTEAFYCMTLSMLINLFKPPQDPHSTNVELFSVVIFQIHKLLSSIQNCFINITGNYTLIFKI